MRCLLLCICVFSASLILKGQQQATKNSHKKSIKEILEQLSREKNIVFAYDADKLGLLFIEKIPEFKNIDDFLQKLLEKYPYQFENVEAIYMIYYDESKDVEKSMRNNKKETPSSKEVEKEKQDKKKSNYNIVPIRIKEKTIKIKKKQVNVYQEKLNKPLISQLKLNSTIQEKNRKINFFETKLRTDSIILDAEKYLGQSDYLYSLSFISDYNFQNSRESKLFNSLNNEVQLMISDIPVYLPQFYLGTLSPFNVEEYRLALKANHSAKNLINLKQHSRRKLNIELAPLSVGISGSLLKTKKIISYLSVKKSITNNDKNPWAKAIFNNRKQFEDYIYYKLCDRTFFISDSINISTNFYTIFHQSQVMLNKHHIDAAFLYGFNQLKMEENETDPYFTFHSIQNNQNNQLGGKLIWDAKWNDSFQSNTSMIFTNYSSLFENKFETFNNYTDIQNEIINFDANRLSIGLFKNSISYYFKTQKIEFEVETKRIHTKIENTSGLLALKEIESIYLNNRIRHSFKIQKLTADYGLNLLIAGDYTTLLPEANIYYQKNKLETSLQYSYVQDDLNRELISGSNSDPVIYWNVPREKLNNSHQIRARLNYKNDKLKVSFNQDLQFTSNYTSILLVQNENYEHKYKAFKEGSAFAMNSRLMVDYRNRFWNNTSSLSFYHSKLLFQELNQGEKFSNPMFPGYQLKSANAFSLGNFTLTANYYLIGNKHYFTPVGQHYIKYSSTSYSELLKGDVFYSNVLPLYQKLDFGISYHQSTSAGNLKVNLNLYNVLNTKNSERIKYEAISYINTISGTKIPVYRLKKFNAEGIMPFLTISWFFN